MSSFPLSIRSAFLFLFVLTPILTTSQATAQSDAEQALKDARIRFSQERFEEAAELLVRASQTDRENPDIFLLLGRARYQLGDVSGAVEAWNQTLKLAPAQAYARRMVDSLSGKVTDVDKRIDIIESMVHQRPVSSTKTAIDNLRKGTLSSEQRVRLLTLEAEAFVVAEQFDTALNILSELAVRDPELASTAKIRVLVGAAKLGFAGSAIEGMKILKGIVEDAPESAEGMTAELALIQFRLNQNEDVLDELSAWISANPDHPRLVSARHATVQSAVSLLNTAMQQAGAKSGDGLSDKDKRFLGAAKLAFQSVRTGNEIFELTQRTVSYIHNRFIHSGGFPESENVLSTLLDLDLPQSSRDLLVSTQSQAKSAAATAEFTAIASRIYTGDAAPAELVDWLDAYPKHSKVDEARRVLLTGYLTSVKREGPPRPDAKLSDAERAAIELVGQAVESAETIEQKSMQLLNLRNHWKEYLSAKAYGAAISGQQATLKLPLPKPLRRELFSDLIASQIASVMDRIGRDVTAGNLKRGPLPADLASLLKTFNTVHTEFPSAPAWTEQTSVVDQLVAQTARIPWPEKVTDLKPGESWTLQFAIPVVQNSLDHAAVGKSIASIDKIVNAAAAVNQESSLGLGSRTHQKLLDALGKEHPHWAPVAKRQLQLRIADDALRFQRDIHAGRGYLYATLSDQQKAILSLAADIVSQSPAKAAAVLGDLQPFLDRRTAAGHADVVDQAYSIVQNSLPPQQARVVRLAVARSRIDKVLKDHSRMIGAGLQPPEALDETLKTALVRCYELQAELQPDAAFVKEVQAVRARVITHYRNLRYRQSAAEAIAVRSDTPVDWIEAAAEFELATVKLSDALEDLDQVTRQFQGRENITLTPAIKEAIAGLEQFITSRPADQHVLQAVNKIFSVGKRFEGYEKYDIAAEVYLGLETFAAANETLQKAEPDGVAQRAAFAVALAKHVKASDLLQKATERDADPPTKLSDEFQAAIDAYGQILTRFPEGALVSAAISKIMEIGLQHANAGAWEVASAVYGDLQSRELPLRQPERLELARALCEMGKVVPDHAKQVLLLIALWDKRTTNSSVDPNAVAFQATPERFGDLFGNGIEASMMEEMDAGGMDDMMGMDEMMDMEMAMGSSAPATNMPQAEAPMAGTPIGGGVGGGGFGGRATARASREQNLLAAVRQQQSAIANRVAMLRDNQIQQVERMPQQQAEQSQAAAPSAKVLSDAEIVRRQTILDLAYQKLQTLRQTYPDTESASQARDQIMVIVNHWRSIQQWEHSASLVKRFLQDNPSDIQLPKLRHDIARDYLAWASGAVQPEKSKQELLDQVNERFANARQELSGIVAAFPDQTELKHAAQWDIASSHLSQARVVAGFSSTLARGQFVRAANELLKIAGRYHDHPKINEVPQMLANIAGELTQRRFYDEAITVWNEMTLQYPGHPVAEQAALQIAQTYQNKLRLPLRAVESYLELNFARGGSDVALQDAIFQIASQLMNEKRWVESLHVLETFIDSFPTHGSAGQALAMIGQVHQTNEVWEDAIAAYSRVILEYDQGNWAQQSKWSIAECTINLSRWEEAQGAYREYQKAYPQDPKVAEATKRLEILKDLARFQKVVDEEGQRKAFDAQFQIGTIVRDKLANPIKAIIEYRKVAEGWPESHLADDALFQVGMIYMSVSQTENAREAFLATAERYPSSPLADDALFQVGASFENEAQVLVGVTRGRAIEIANEVAQKQAYTVSQDNRKSQRLKTLDKITQLRREGKRDEAERQTGFQAALNVAFDNANAAVVANWAAQQEEVLTTAQLADRQDKINAALRRAVASFRRAASVTSADKADDALLRMAQIYDQRLKDSDAAMTTWLEIVKQYSGTTVAEDASWKIAQYYETHEKYSNAISAYNSFLRNYRRSPKASAAQAAIAENHEQLGNWVEAMDAYTNYINNYPEGTLASKAKEQIAWIKTYRL